MEKRQLELFAHFNKESNNLMNDSIKTLSDEQWKKQFSGFYKSIQEICAHIYFWDYNTLNRFKSLRKFTCFDEKFQHEEYLDMYTIKISEDGKEYLHEKFTSSKTLFANSPIDEYIKMRIDLDNLIIKIVNEITVNDLDMIIKTTTVTGNKFEKRIGGVLMENFVHDTHHRGMISLYLEMLGTENDFYSNPCPILWSPE